MARTFQRLEVFGSLTAHENVLAAAEFRRAWSEDKTRPARTSPTTILERVGLRRVADERVDALPTGLARLVELGRALATRPQLLLLDEPASGLDSAESEALGDLLIELAEPTAWPSSLVEHDVELVMRVCDQHPRPRLRPHHLRRHPARGAGRPGRPGRLPRRRGPVRRSRHEPAGTRRTTYALELRGRRAGYGRIEVLHGVDLQVPAGTVFALLGPNGAGKTTTLQVVLRQGPGPRPAACTSPARTSTGSPRRRSPGPACAASPRAAASSPT